MTLPNRSAVLDKSDQFYVLLKNRPHNDTADVPVLHVDPAESSKL